MHFINIIIFIFINLIIIGLGFVAYERKKSLTNRLFFWFTLSLVIWSLFNFLETWTSNKEVAELFLKLDFATAPIFTYFLTIFLLNFPYTNKKLDSLKKRMILFIPILIISVLSVSNYVITNINISNNSVKFDLGIGYSLYAFVIIIYFLSGILNLLKNHKKSSYLEKLQIKYILAGFLTTFTLLIIFNLFLQNYISSEIFRIGNYSPIILVAFTTYAIAVHRLLDIKLVMRKWSVYFTSLVSVIIPAFFIEYGFSDLFGVDSFLTDILIIAIAVAFFPVIKNYYFNFANKYLFSSLYDSKQVIANLSEQLGSTLELDKIYNLIDETLSNAFHSKAVGVLKFNNKTNEYAVKYDHGFNFGRIKSLKANKKIQDSYISKNRIIVAEELKNTNIKEFIEFARMLEKMGIEILTPLTLKNEAIGMIVLGPKESGDMYNDEDFGVLKIMGVQVAIAMDNAFLYEKTRNFNKKLKKEVEVATADLVAANEQLKKLDTAKSEFISIASHQLRTPLTAIKGYISMMLEGDFGQLTKSEAESLQKVFESNERLIRLVENLLNISRIESGRLQFDYTDVQLDDMVASVIDELSGHAKKKGLKLEFKKPSSPLPKIHIDDEKIRQVVMNMIDNAIKYTKQGSVTVSLEQTFAGNPEPKPELLFSVSDSGMGIRKEDLPNLFQKFSRGTGTSLVHTEGTGLGLYVARQMIEAHKGEIWAESKGEGLGSKFCFKIPV